MPKRSRKGDFAQNALRVVEISTGAPLVPKQKDPAAVSLGRRGGMKGGKARAEKLTEEERHTIAQKAARARWEKKASEDQVAAGWGDVWTWTALDADSKLIVSYLVGQRGANWAKAFLEDVASRVSNRIQLTTDGHHVYVDAVEGAFGADVDYAMLIKLYGTPTDRPETRYSPGECIGIDIKRVTGNPDPRHISTSYVERSNLTMRMSMRRFTRLTNGFSKKLENHEYMLAIYYVYYNFCRVHQTLRVTPAMEAGIADHVWSVEEMVSLMEPKSILDGLQLAG